MTPPQAPSSTPGGAPASGAAGGPRRELLLGVDDAPPVPMQQGSPEAGDFRGYEVDLLEALAGRLGAALRYRRAYWSAIVADLAAGRVDPAVTALVGRRVGVRAGTTAAAYARAHGRPRAYA